MNRVIKVFLSMFFIILSLLTPLCFYYGILCFLVDLRLFSLVFVPLPFWVADALSVSLKKHCKRSKFIKIVDWFRIGAVMAFLAASILLSLMEYMFPTIILVVLFLAGVALWFPISEAVKELCFPFKKRWIIAIACITALIIALGILVFVI